MKFTTTNLKTLQPKKAAYRIFEKGPTKGFGVQVTPRGKVSYFLCFQLDGKTKYKTLGTFPDLSLEDARGKAKELRADIDAGQFGVEKKQTGTLGELVEFYYSHLDNTETLREVSRIMEKDVFPVVGRDRPANEVTADDIREVLHLIIKRGSKAIVNRTRSYLMSAFKKGIAHDNDPRYTGSRFKFDLPGNPVMNVPVIGEYERPGERVLTLEELVQVLNYDGTAISETCRMILRLMVFCGGLRQGEVYRARVDEIDVETRLWSIPPGRTKNERWHVIPLSEYTAGVLELAIAYSSGSEFLFPGRGKVDKPMYKSSLQHATTRLINDLGMEYWSPRDLRRTVKTWAGYAGLSKEIRDRLQNHALTDVSAKHYDRHLYIREKREALEKWEGFLVDAGAELSFQVG